jgi:hypothetical protein
MLIPRGGRSLKVCRGMLFLQVISSRQFNRGVLLWVFVGLPTLGIGGGPLTH